MEELKKDLSLLPLVFHLKNTSETENKTVRLFDKDEKDIQMHPHIDNVTYQELVISCECQPFEVLKILLIKNKYELPPELPITVIQGDDEGRSRSIPFWGLTQSHNNMTVIYWDSVRAIEELLDNRVNKNTVWEMSLPPKFDAYLRVYPEISKTEKDEDGAVKVDSTPRMDDTE